MQIMVLSDRHSSLVLLIRTFHNFGTNSLSEGVAVNRRSVVGYMLVWRKCRRWKPRMVCAAERWKMITLREESIDEIFRI